MTIQRQPLRTGCLLASILGCIAAGPGPTQRTERFDSDPHWEAVNNRPSPAIARTVRQDFGYSLSHNAGGAAGEAGGFVTPAAEPAYYAKRIAPRTFQDAFGASGLLSCPGPKTHVLLGFFNSGTLNEWRTPSSIVIRLQGRGDHFYAYVEYATQKWRAGGDSPGGFATVRDPATGRSQLKGFPGGNAVYRWSLRYDPAANQGGGAIYVTLGDQSAVCNLDAGHKADGAVFNRFGLLNVIKSVDDGGEVWIDDVAVDGAREDFARDPGWQSFQSRRSYRTTNVRPHGDFGYSPTAHAGGRAGEMGGLVFRGDCRYPGAMASYADRLQDLTLLKPLTASGRVSMLRGVSDSTTLVGFFHSRDSMTVNASQRFALPRSFLGAAIEGPSREGFLFYPAYRVRGDAQGYATGDDLPHILPNGASHLWTLRYTPGEAGAAGHIIVTLDGRSAQVAVPAADGLAATHFDRFGIVTTWIDGNGQRVYFDDLTYTARQQ
jgi:hypothetical protein